MNIRHLDEINWGFGYHPSSMHESDSWNKLKVAMYVPVINLVAIGIIITMAKEALFTEPEGRWLLLRIVVSVVAAPILLPIDIIATVALRSLMKKARMTLEEKWM